MQMDDARTSVMGVHISIGGLRDFGSAIKLLDVDGNRSVHATFLKDMGFYFAAGEITYKS